MIPRDLAACLADPLYQSAQEEVLAAFRREHAERPKCLLPGGLALIEQATVRDVCFQLLREPPPIHEHYIRPCLQKAGEGAERSYGIPINTKIYDALEPQKKRAVIDAVFAELHQRLSQLLSGGVSRKRGVRILLQLEQLPDMHEELRDEVGGRFVPSERRS